MFYLFYPYVLTSMIGPLVLMCTYFLLSSMNVFVSYKFFEYLENINENVLSLK